MQKPFTDPNKSVCIEQALVRAYEAKDRVAIEKAAQEAQKYVDEGGDFMTKYDESLSDYQGDSPERLTGKYLLRLLRDRHCDDDDDRDYIRTGWHVTMSATYRQFKELKKKYSNALLLFREDDTYCSYEEDADALHEVLDLPLLFWNGIKAAGFPHHALDMMLTKLVRAGYRVAVCDPLTDPAKARKQVERTKELHKKFYPEKHRKEPVQLSLW